MCLSSQAEVIVAMPRYRVFNVRSYCLMDYICMNFGFRPQN